MLTSIHRPTRTRALLLAAAFVTLSVAAACSSTTTPTTTSGADAGSSGDVDGAATNALGAKCAAETTIESCATCCGGKDSLDPYQKAYEACACDSQCKTQCAATLCAATPVESDTACDDCLYADTTVGECDPVAVAACDKDTKCAAFTACDGVASCLAKGDGGL